MIRRIFIIQCALMLALAVFPHPSVFSQDDVTAVQDSAFRERMRPRVDFYHEEHNEKAEIEECSVCHHVYEGGKMIEEESSEDMECSECHLNDDNKAVFSLVKVYHQQCRQCHLEQKKGPITCNECHARKYCHCTKVTG